MDTYSKVGRAEQDLKWARIWFKQFSVFHHRRGEDQRPFTADEVVAFLQSKRDAKVPAWKPMKIIEALMAYRLRVQKQGVEDLVPLQKKMEQIIEVEHAKNGGFDAIDGVVGVINPLEPDAIQAFRRALRSDGKSYATETAYVQNLKAFMTARGLRCLADFEPIGDQDVEAHLSDLAVDGNVAPSTQNCAYYAMVKFFKLVLKQDMGRIEAIRASKGTFVTTVLGHNDVKTTEIYTHVRNPQESGVVSPLDRLLGTVSA